MTNQRSSLVNWDTFKGCASRVVIMVGAQEEPALIRTNLSKQGVCVFSVECARCASLDTFLTQVGAAFSFPSYYGENLDAFEECFSMPDYLGQVDAVFLFSEGHRLLVDETDSISKVTQIIASAGHAWTQIERANGLRFFSAFIVSDKSCVQAMSLARALEFVDRKADRIGESPWLQRVEDSQHQE